jgi:WD40 repeat protein/tetratricopeptide (TPR) repeat protein
VVPGYEILAELGRGGMGVVYRARHLKLNRVVALKMVLAGGHAGPDDLARFLAEAEAVAALQHPHIVQLYDFGQHDGLPFFTLEFVPGGSLADKLNGAPLPPKEAARLVEQLAHGVHYAHGKGIVHRDLKPANVLLAEDGTPKVTDFGLAKRVEVGSGLTATGAILGTPSYMTPEQAGGQGKRVGPAADVYALGAVLYECLTGRPPFRAATTLDTILQVVGAEPVSVRQLQPGVPADLETVCHRCLQKEPAKRYASALELAEDLRRFRADQPVRARPVGSAERAWRWCRRNPLVAGLLGAVSATLLLGTGVATYFAVQARAAASQARDNETQALREKQEAERQLTRAEGLVYAGQLDRAQQYWREGNAAAARDLLDRCRWDYRGWEHDCLHTLFNASHLTLRGHSGGVTSVCFSPDGRRIACASGDLSGVKVWDAQTGRELLTLQGHNGAVTSVCYSPDGRCLASGSTDHTVKVWDAQTGRELRTLQVVAGWDVGISFSPDSRRLAATTGSQTKVWDAQTGRELFTLQGDGGHKGSVSFSPDGRRLATACGRTLRVWDAQTGRELRMLDVLDELSWAISSVCFSPDGRRLASNSAGQTVKVWEVDTGQQLLTFKGHTAAVTSVCFSPDGRLLASAGGAGLMPGEVKVWNARTGQELLAPKGHTAEVTSVCFSPDGRLLASADGSHSEPPSPGEVKVWDVRTGQEQLTLNGPPSEVRLYSPTAGVCFSPDGRRIASTSGATYDQQTGEYYGQVKVRDAQTGQDKLTLRGGTANFFSVCFSPDGRRIAGACEDTTVMVWDAQTGQELLSLQGHTAPVYSVCFSPDGRRLASASGGLTPFASGPLTRFDGGKPGKPGEVKVWDAQTGRDLLTLPGHTGVFSVSFSPDGHRLASASGDWNKPGDVRVWDAQTGQELRTLQGHTDGVVSVCFSPDGHRLASASLDRTVKLWEAQTGQELLTFQGHIGGVASVCFSPDGKRLASGSGDQTAKVWDAQTGQEVLSLKGHASVVNSVCFSPDGRRLATAFSDQTVEVWDAQARQEQFLLKGHTGPVTGVGFSYDGTRVVAANARGQVRSWDAHTGQEVVPCTDPAPTPEPQAVSPDGEHVVRIDHDQPVVEPRVLHGGDLFRQRLADPVGDYLWHLRLAREARANHDAFALAFHLEPLLLTAFAQRAARPRDAFPQWAKRPPLSGVQAQTAADAVQVTAVELEELHHRLSARLQATPRAWEAWAGRGWCRHLLGDFAGATADLNKAIELHPEEPGLWAVLGTVYLQHHRGEEAEAVYRRLAGWAGIDVAVWDSVEADAAEREQDWALASWHLDHWLARLPSPSADLLARRGYCALELGRDQDAARAYAAAVAVSAGRTDTHTLIWGVRACLAAGDRGGFQQSRAALLEQLKQADVRGFGHRAAGAVLLAPAAATDLDPLLKSFPASILNTEIQTTRGGLLLRAGRFPEAIAPLERACAQRQPAEPPVADLLLALALQKQGQTEAARRTLERARFLLDAEAPVRQAADLLGGGTAGPLPATVAAALQSARPHWDLATRLETRILRREAEEVLGEHRP